MADSSTMVTGIPIPIAGGCWPRHQLHAGIRYVPVASKPRISLGSTSASRSYKIRPCHIKTQDFAGLCEEET